MKDTLNDKKVLAAKVIGGTTNTGKPITCTDIYDTLCPGLCLRVTADKKSWGFVFTRPGSRARARHSLGTYPTTSLADARQRAEEFRAGLQAGHDPRLAKPAAPDNPLLGDAIAEYLAEKVTGVMKREADAKYRFAKYITPILKDVPIKDFRINPHYNLIIGPLVMRGKKCMAGLVYSHLYALFMWAFKKDYIETNFMMKPENPYTYKASKRFLTEQEIPIWWHSLPIAFSDQPEMQDILKLCLATGQRCDEVCGMNRDELDLGNRIWTLPAKRTKSGWKSGEQHEVVLNDIALRLIKGALARTNSKFVFPRLNDPTKPRHSNFVASAVVRARNQKSDNKLGVFGIAFWKTHALRHTVVSHMARLGIQSLHVSYCLNHRTETKQTQTQITYDHDPHLGEKWPAMMAWGNELARLVGEQVETLKAAE